MRGRPIEGGPEAVKANAGKSSLMRRWMQLGLTGRMFLLVVIAVLPALVIQAVNEYALRTAREDEIRQRVIQITKQFGEEIQAIRAGASQLLIALGELDEVQKRDSAECGATFAKLKVRFESYVRIGAADATGKTFCSSGPVMRAVLRGAWNAIVTPAGRPGQRPSRTMPGPVSAGGTCSRDDPARPARRPTRGGHVHPLPARRDALPASHRVARRPRRRRAPRDPDVLPRPERARRRVERVNVSGARRLDVSCAHRRHAIGHHLANPKIE